MPLFLLCKRRGDNVVSLRHLSDFISFDERLLIQVCLSESVNILLTQEFFSITKINMKCMTVFLMQITAEIENCSFVIWKNNTRKTNKPTKPV